MISALTIAGSDPSGGAGVQADLKVFHHHRVYGMSVITLLTAQNTIGVSAVYYQTPQIVRAQLDAVLTDIKPNAIKTGALGTVDVIEEIAERLNGLQLPLVVDPVMISKHGAVLMAADAQSALISRLLPLATLITPNVPEAETISGIAINCRTSMRLAAQKINTLGAKFVLIKGGHLQGDPIDLLYSDGRFIEFKGIRVDTTCTHGTGCVLSATITALLAHGVGVESAVQLAKDFITRALKQAEKMGHGIGPVNLFVPAALSD